MLAAAPSAIGGDFHGQGTTPTALNTIVQSNTLIQANATVKGNGGKVAVWSNNNTTFNGTIEAKGGAKGGTGGFVETSGKNLSASGLVNASAAKGNAGTWLLDPNNVTISTGTNTNETGSPNFTLTGTPAIINTTTLTTPLNSGTNVSVTASGSIIVANNITENTYNGTVGLTLNAGTDITLNTGVGITASRQQQTQRDARSLDTALGGGAIVMNSGSSDRNQWRQYHPGRRRDPQQHLCRGRRN